MLGILVIKCQNIINKTFCASESYDSNLLTIRLYARDFCRVTVYDNETQLN